MSGLGNVMNWLLTGRYDTGPGDSYVRAPSESAVSGGYMSGGAKIQGGITGDGRHLSVDHRRVNTNSRARWHDSVQAHGIINRFADTIADKGLSLSLQPVKSVIGRDDDFIREKARDIEQRWSRWANSKGSTIGSTDTFNQTFRLYQLYRHRDGESFHRIYYNNNNPALLSTVQVQMIDPMMVRGYPLTSTTGMYSADDGIIRDDYGEERAYRVWWRNSAGEIEEKVINRFASSGRVMMLHCYSREYAGQGRGYSRLAHAQQELASVLDLDIAHIQKAINQASIFAAKETTGEDSGNLLQGFTRSAASSVFRNAAETGELATDEIPPLQVEDAPLTKPGLALFGLKKGEKLSFLKDTAPNESYASFLYEFMSYLSASAGMPIEMLLMRFSNNYSASMATIVMFWQIVEIERDEMASDYAQPVFEAWLAEEIAAGRISLPGWSDPFIRAAWLNTKWYGSPMPIIDPVKQANARRINLELGLTTMEREARNLNGSDAESNRAALKREFADFPIAPWSYIRQTIKKNDNDNDGEEDKE